jgi:hypothetical protein
LTILGLKGFICIWWVGVQDGEYLYALQTFKMVGVVWAIILVFGAFISVIKPWGRIGKANDEVEPSPVGTT